MSNMYLKDIDDQKYITSYNIDCLGHCKMHLIQEELYRLGKINVLTIGSHECCYYSVKLQYPNGIKNYAYCLEDNEIVFGDMSKIESVISQLAEDENKTVIIQTCVPSIMNLDFESIIDTYPDKIILMNVPDYAGINSADCIKELYVRLFKDIGLKIDDINSEKTELWLKNETYSYDEIIKKLSCKNHIVYSIYYLDMLKTLQTKYGYEIDNKALFNYEKFVDIIDSSEDNKQVYKEFIKGLKSHNNILLNTSFNIELLYVLTRNNIDVNYLTINFLNEDKKRLIDQIETINPLVIKKEEIPSLINNYQDIFVLDNSSIEFEDDLYINLLNIMKGAIEKWA